MVKKTVFIFQLECLPNFSITIRLKTKLFYFLSRLYAEIETLHGKLYQADIRNSNNVYLKSRFVLLGNNNNNNMYLQKTRKCNILLF